MLCGVCIHASATEVKTLLLLLSRMILVGVCRQGVVWILKKRMMKMRGEMDS